MKPEHTELPHRVDEPLSPEWAEFVERVRAAPSLDAIRDILQQKVDELSGESN